MTDSRFLLISKIVKDFYEAERITDNEVSINVTSWLRSPLAADLSDYEIAAAAIAYGRYRPDVTALNIKDSCQYFFYDVKEELESLKNINEYLMENNISVEELDHYFM